MEKLKNYLILGVLGSSVLLTSCGDDDEPAVENEPEEFNRITLTFSDSDPATSDVVAVWFDEDADGVGEPTQDEINLAANTTYTLSIEIFNTIVGEDVTEEIRDEEPLEHQLFFGFTANIFTSPEGDGNIGANSSGDDMNYVDLDANDNPIGLITTWSTGGATTDATFTTILKHQPGATEADPPLKNATSTSETGESDFDLDWVINIL